MGQRHTNKIKPDARRAASRACVAVLLALALLAGCAKQTREPAEKVYLHRVEPGETLADIAGEFYDNPTMANIIGEFNDVNDEDLKDGMVLRVPLTNEDVERLDLKERAREPYNIGLELAEQGAYVDAVQEFNKSLAIDPTFVDAVYNLGVTYQKIEQYDRAREQFEDAVRLRPEEPEYRFALGTCRFYLDRFGDAASDFEKVMVLDPSHTKALYSLAVCYEKQEEKGKAIEAWRRYLELDSKSAWATEARKHLKELE
jgi:tetratricopeptide (TPR) repeat protein